MQTQLNQKYWSQSHPEYIIKGNVSPSFHFLMVDLEILFLTRYFEVSLSEMDLRIYLDANAISCTLRSLILRPPQILGIQHHFQLSITLITWWKKSPQNFVNLFNLITIKEPCRGKIYWVWGNHLLDNLCSPC